jgi:hypothetical protein
MIHHAWFMLGDDPHTAATAASDKGRVWRSAGALGLARHLMHKETHLPQGVRSPWDEKERLDTSGLPPVHLVNTGGTRADHVVGVGVFHRPPSRLRDPDASWPWDIAGAAHARELFWVL